jgi:hypothetical protein
MIFVALRMVIFPISSMFTGSAASPTFIYGVALDPVLNIVPSLKSLVLANQVRMLEINMSSCLTFIFMKMEYGLSIKSIKF